MNNQDRNVFYTIWIRACEPYGKNFVPNPEGLEYVFNLLKRYDLNEIMAALAAHALSPEEGRFAPKPADIVRHIQGDSASMAQMAWTKVITAIERVGTYESVVFDDAIIMATVRDMGGWLELNRITNDEVPFKKNEFVTRYRGYLNNPPSSHPQKFIGIAEMENERNGIKHDTTPRLLGDHQKCLAVYKSGGEKRAGITRLADVVALEDLNKNTKQVPTLELMKHA